MDEDWSADVRKYSPGADEGVIAGIVRYCGIALRNRDSSLVSFTEAAETDRVRENYLKKKLGLTNPDAELDAAIASVGERMSGDSTRNRVTVYYLLAEHFGKLGLFAGPAGTVSTAVPLAATGVAAPGLATAGLVPGAHRRREGVGLWPLIPLLLLILAAIGIFAIVSSKRAPVAAPVVAVAPAPPVLAPVAAAIPEGMGLTTQEVDGKPEASVYFDTARTEVSPEIVSAAATMKAWIDANPGARLAVSGYNDPRGDAAMNAELSKNRAFAVRDALVANGIPAEAIELIKPEATSDTTTSLENARRVDIKVI